MTSFKFEFDSIDSQFQERDSYNGTWAIQGYTVSAPDDVYDGMCTFGFLYANPEVTWEDFPASIIGSQKWYQKEYKRLEDERERRENELDYDLSEEYYPIFKDLDMKAEEFENWIFSKDYSFDVLKINSFNYKCTYSKWDECGDCDEYKEGVKAKFKVFGTTCFGQSFEIKAEDDDASFEPDENVIAYMCSYTETEYESKMNKAYVPNYIPFKEMVNKMRNTRNNDRIVKGGGATVTVALLKWWIEENITGDIMSVLDTYIGDARLHLPQDESEIEGDSIKTPWGYVPKWGYAFNDNWWDE